MKASKKVLIVSTFAVTIFGLIGIFAPAAALGDLSTQLPDLYQLLESSASEKSGCTLGSTRLCNTTSADGYAMVRVCTAKGIYTICRAEGKCGDKVTNGPEVCDSNWNSCMTEDGYAGRQRCNNKCTGFSQRCLPLESCGDNICNGLETAISCNQDCQTTPPDEEEPPVDDDSETPPDDDDAGTPPDDGSGEPDSDEDTPTATAPSMADFEDSLKFTEGDTWNWEWVAQSSVPVKLFIQLKFEDGEWQSIVDGLPGEALNDQQYTWPELNEVRYAFTNHLAGSPHNKFTPQGEGSYKMRYYLINSEHTPSSSGYADQDNVAGDSIQAYTASYTVFNKRPEVKNFLANGVAGWLTVAAGEEITFDAELADPSFVPVLGLIADDAPWLVHLNMGDDTGLRGWNALPNASVVSQPGDIASQLGVFKYTYTSPGVYLVSLSVTENSLTGEGNFGESSVIIEVL